MTSLLKAKSFADQCNESTNRDQNQHTNEDDDESGDDDTHLFSASFSEFGLKNVKMVYSLWVSVFRILVSLGLFTLSAIIPFVCDDQFPDDSNNMKKVPALCTIKPISLLVYIHCGVWGFYLICDQIIQYEHMSIRRRGFLEFYEETRVSSQLPFWILSAWSTLLLAVATILHDHCNSDITCAKSIHLTRTEYITICIGLETLAILVAISNYLYQVIRFNASMLPADVFRDDMMSSVLDFNPNSAGEIDDEIFHRQADTIRYYKDRNTTLLRTVHRLQTRVLSNENGQVYVNSP